MSHEDSRSPSERNRPHDSPGDAQTRRDVLGLWAGIIAGPTLWFTHQQVCFVLVPWVCDHGGVMWLHGTTLVLLGATLAAGWLARSYWLREDREARLGPQITNAAVLQSEPNADEPPRPLQRTAGQQRVRFMAILGVFSCAFFALVIIAQEIPNFFIDPCQR